MPMLLSRPVPALHDVMARRESMEQLFTTLGDSLPSSANVNQDWIKFKAIDGAELSILHAQGAAINASTPSAAIFHIHGGGMIGGSVTAYRNYVAMYATLSGLPVFSVDYRLAPEHPAPGPAEDCYSGLQHVQSSAAKFNIDPSRIAVMGDSAGGGLAASVALMARDRGLSPKLAKQILIYPMLDDCNLESNPKLEPFLTWTTESNITGWSAYVGRDKAGKPEADVSPYAAPARAKDLSGLPRTYIDVGELDSFKVEDMTYATRLAAANVPIEFHVYPGVPHAFEVLAPGIEVTKKCFANRVRAMKDF